MRIGTSRGSQRLVSKAEIVIQPQDIVASLLRLFTRWAVLSWCGPERLSRR